MAVARKSKSYDRSVKLLENIDMPYDTRTNQGDRTQDDGNRKWTT